MRHTTLTIANALVFISSQASASFTFYAAHPHAAQLSAGSDNIEDLMLYRGSIYSGYGTHANHSNPLSVCSFTPPSTRFSCPITIDSEGAAHFRNIDNKLYIVGIDPRAPSNHFYARKSGSSWLLQPAFTSNVAHVYDVERHGGFTWVTLSKFDDDSRVMRGTDGGSWVESLHVTPVTGHTTTNYSTLFFIAQYNGKLYTQAYDTEDGIQPFSYVSSNNGATWSQGPSIMLHSSNPNGANGVQNYRHEVIAGKLVMKQNNHLVSFDGSSAITIHSDVRNLAFRDGYLYVLEKSGRIIRSQNLTNWQYVDTAPANASSIEIDDNDVYVGTEDSDIYWSENILDKLPRVVLAPIIELLLNQ